MNRYDVVIIGSGLGGLCCGAILAGEGLGVCIIEKEVRVGGCLCSYTRHGHVFDTGIHYIGNMDEGQMLNRILRYCGVYDRLHLSRLDEEGFDVIHLGGREYRFAQGYERFGESLREQFPQAGAQIEAYVRALQRVGRAIGGDVLQRGKFSEGSMDFMALSASQEIDRLITDPRLRQVVAGTNFLYDGIRDVSTFYHHAMINHSFLTGACRLADGSSHLADALAGEIRSRGGEILTGDGVRRVLHDGEKVLGVECVSGRRIECREVVSDIDPKLLMEMILPGGGIRPAYRRRIESLTPGFGVFTVNAVVDGEMFPYLNANHYLIEDEDVWSNASRRKRPREVMFSMGASTRPLPHREETVCLLSPMYYDEVERWSDTLTGRRGAEYEEFKARVTEQMIDLADRHMRGFRRSILHLHSSSPLTYRDYTGTVRGAAYGRTMDCRDVLRTLLSPRTKLRGLYLTGQNVAVHGALGVGMTALSTCGAMLGEEYLARKMANL